MTSIRRIKDIKGPARPELTGLLRLNETMLRSSHVTEYASYVSRHTMNKASAGKLMVCQTKVIEQVHTPNNASEISDGQLVSLRLPMLTPRVVLQLL